ncbi:ThiF family adenylyltransferase [Metapseudomonas furukawaii]|mgnify:CR=1 FL=1|uniref:Sulfur carrier protein adenylyltransferase ThiF n=1 Tax=Metapseudomonas furukawaii TaxID=1149133 RepID=A0AAD1BXL8_METFU|nr:ThiF family adenylyltransferase [Pseudomonas furukawaii]ELS27937.1 Sulfur carrier protein adenylyltransferase ThiF [Pseudomonas furukawaii]BAU73082.1 sulfur carrier protein adenylyltransferase ThiF [Pseudomonas furukawaii]
MAEPSDEELIPELLERLKPLGFSRTLRQKVGGNLVLTGALRTNDGPVACSIAIDREFRRIPRVTLLEIPPKLLPVAPHLGSGGELCYAATGTYVFDIFNPIEQTLAFIQRAEQVLGEIMRGELIDDLAEEFFAYWWGAYCYIDTDRLETGELQVFSSGESERSGRTFEIFLTDDLARTSKKLSLLRDEFTQENFIIHSISTSARPRPSQDSWPPKTLGDFVNWQYQLDKNVPKKLLRRVAAAYRSEFGACLFVISSPLYKYGLIVKFPDLEERRALRKAANGFQYLYELKITPVATFRIDDRYLVERNIPGVKNLSGLKIGIVGCGTIGGYLAELLVKAGAGLAGGKLTLIDPDEFGPQNLGRHRLGFTHLYRPKAIALADELSKAMPSAGIEGVPLDVRDVRLPELDLLIDATGDEAVGYWIAAQYHKVVPILNVWIEGRGAAVRTLFKLPGIGACYRCLCDYNKDRHFVSVSEDFGEIFAGHGCEGLYVPFPATVSVQAACLSAEAILDWVGGWTLPSLRTRVTDPNFTLSTDDCSPLVKIGCPACCT